MLSSLTSTLRTCTRSLFRPTLSSSILSSTASTTTQSLNTCNSFNTINGYGTGQVRTMASQKHKRVLKLTKGFRGASSKIYTVALEKLEKSMQYAYRDRKTKKRTFRSLWIQRINASLRLQNLSYSRFIEMEKRSSIGLNRKVLSELCVYEPLSFKAVVDVVKARGVGGGPESGEGYPLGKGYGVVYKEDGSVDRRGY